MARSRNFVRGSDDPQARALDDLDDRPTPGPPASRPRGRRSGESRAVPLDFPECPPDRGERTWRLVRLFIETGETYGRTRVVSPWLLGKELAARLSTDNDVSAFIAEYGADWAEDILTRMIRIYWRDYVDSSTSRTMVVNQYLDDYWADLFDQAKTQYATDEFQRLEAAGMLKTKPHQGFQSLLNDPEYQAAMRDIKVEGQLREQLMNPLNPDGANDHPEPASESDSGKVITRGDSRRKRAGGDPGHP